MGATPVRDVSPREERSENLQFVRNRLEVLVAERFMRGGFAAEQQAEFERLCAAEERLLGRRNGDIAARRG